MNDAARAALIRLIRENLGEAKRYLKRSPGVAKQMVETAMEDLRGLDSITADRLIGNLRVGLDYMQVDPDVVRGYLDAAYFELLSVK